MMKKTSIPEFKEILRQGMMKEFNLNGSLTPIMFFYKGGQPIITEIPNNFLINSTGKVALGNIIRKICQEADTTMAGIIMEAYGAKISVEEDSEEAKAILSEQKKRIDERYGDIMEAWGYD